MDQQRGGGRIRRSLLVAAGTVALGLAVLGMVLPLVPTTPFLLMAAAFYLRGSSRLHRWLTQHRLFGRYLRNYHEGTITRRDRLSTLLVLWIGMVVSASLMDLWPLRVLLFGIAVGVTIHLSRLRTVDHDGAGPESVLPEPVAVSQDEGGGSDLRLPANQAVTASRTKGTN